MLLLATCSVILAGPAAPASEDTRILLRVLPPLVYVTQRSEQHLSFDLLLTNGTTDTLEVDRLTLQAFDSTGRLALERTTAGNGGVNVALPEPALAPGETRMFFNPFSTVERGVPLSRICFSIRLVGESSGKVATVTAEIRPRPFPQVTRLELPLASRALVTVGGDFLSHHRRLDYTSPPARQLAITSNFARFALDFTAVDSLGRKFRGDGTRNEDWFGFGNPVRAPAAGTVVATHDGQPDNDVVGEQNRFDASTLSGDPMLLYGNHVLIDHGAGEFSVLGHLRNGTVAVAPGARVSAGAVIGRIGSSGSSINPHLHYELRTGPGVRGVEGLPAHFERFRRIYGRTGVPASRGIVESGDIVEPR